MSVYESNLTALFHTNPDFASQINGFEGNKQYEIFMDSNTESLNLVNTQTYTPLYSDSPQKTVEAQKIIFEMFREYPYLNFFGLGNGVLLKYLLDNSKHKRILIVEPDAEIAYIVLNMIDFSQAIESGRLVLLQADSVDFPIVADLFKEMDEHRYARVYDMHMMTPFYELFAEQMHRANQMIIETLHHMVKSSGNDAIDALVGMKHHFANLPTLIKTPTFVNLVKKAKTTDIAILVSAGPSLAKQLPLLKEAAPYVTIFAVDAVFPILAKNGIKPDVVFSIERVKESAKFFKETPKEAYKDVIIGLSSLQHQEVVRSIKGGTVQMSMRPFGYMEFTGPKEWGFVGIGMSSANMAYESIYHAGFKTCVLIGQDLAYGKDGSSHSSGHIFGTDEVKHNDGDIWIEGYGGEEKVRTNEVWTLFRKFFEKDVDAAKQRMQTINATEGGARIYGTVETPFRDVVAPFLKKKQRKKSIHLDQLNSNIQNRVAEQTKERTEHLQAYVVERKEEVETLFLDVANICEYLDANEKVDLLVLDNLFDRIQKFRAYIDDEYFEGVIWNIAQSMLMVQELDLAAIEVHAVNNEEERHQKLIDLIRGYRVWLFSLAGAISAILNAVDMGIEMSIDFNAIEVIRIYVDDEEINTLHVSHDDPLMNNLFDIKQMCIEYVLDEEHSDIVDKVKFYYSNEVQSFKAELYMPAKNDMHFSEFAFKNSLESTLDTKRLENIHGKNKVGFLAVEENLQDNEFMDYFIVLLSKLPEITLNVFCLNDSNKILVEDFFVNVLDRVQIIIVSSIYEFDKYVDIYFSSQKSAIDYSLVNIFKLYSNIATIQYNKDAKALTIANVIELHKSRCKPLVKNQSACHALLQDPIYFGYSREDLIENHYSVHRLLYQKFVGKVEDNDNLYDLLYFRVVEKLMENTQFRDVYIKYMRDEKIYMSGK